MGLADVWGWQRARIASSLVRDWFWYVVGSILSAVGRESIGWIFVGEGVVAAIDRIWDSRKLWKKGSTSSISESVVERAWQLSEGSMGLDMALGEDWRSHDVFGRILSSEVDSSLH